MKKQLKIDCYFFDKEKSLPEMTYDDYSDYTINYDGKEYYVKKNMKHLCGCDKRAGKSCCMVDPPKDFKCAHQVKEVDWKYNKKFQHLLKI